MDFKFTKGLVKMVFIILIAAFVFNIGLFLYAYTNTVNAVESRLTDLTQMAATANCLPREDGVYDAYVRLLAESETQFTRFSDNVGNEQTGNANSYGTWGDAGAIASWAFSVESSSGRNLYSYANPVQRNSPIVCTVRARVVCPFLLMPGWSIGGRSPIYVERTYVVVGQKFYKDLPNTITS